MDHDHIVSGLLAKHDELAGRLAAICKEEKQLLEALGHVDGTIRLYRPTIKFGPVAARRHRPRMEPQGTYVRAAMDILRTSERPLTTRDIAECVLKARGVDEPDQRQIGRLTATIGMALNTRQRKGLVTATGIPKRWETVR